MSPGTRRLALLLVLSACGRDPVAPAAAPAEGAARAAASRVPTRLRVDRAPLRLGGPLTWTTADVVTGMRFCPGDRELIAVDTEGRLRRYGTTDGAQLAVAIVGPSEPVGRPHAVIDCRADGAALVLDAQHSPLLVDASGKTTSPPAPIESDGAAFAADGSVMALVNDGVTRWNGASVEVAIPARDHVLYTGIAERGALAEVIFASGNPSADGLWLTRDGARVLLPGRPGDISQVSVAPDGAVIVADEMIAYGWIMQGASPGKRRLLLDESGFHIKAVAATNRWLIVVDAGGNIRKASRPAMAWKQIDKPCGEAAWLTAIAVAHDDARIAVACSGAGIRVLDLATGAQLSQAGTTSAAEHAAWSPSGDRLATRDANTAIRVWRGSALAATIATEGGDALWWQSADELGGLRRGSVTSWTIADRAAHERTPRLEAAVAAHSRHGELVLAQGTYHDDDEVTIVRGGKTTPVTVPKTRRAWIDELAIDDAGAHAMLTRGEHDRQPALELLEIDVAAGTAALTSLTTTAAAIGDGGAIAVASDTGSVILRSGGASKTLGDMPEGVTVLAISHGVVAAGSYRGGISLWAADGTSLGKLGGHTAPIRALAFAPDGEHLASAASDGTLVWDLTP